MKQLLIILVLFAAACTGNDRKTAETVIEKPVVAEGEVLFKANCAACHKVDKDFTGPALKGSLERWGNDKKTMYDFIRNPAKAVVENAYAKQLYEKWNKTMMTPSNLSDAKLDAIIKYCEDPIQ